jgi:hypothetical protein
MLLTVEAYYHDGKVDLKELPDILDSLIPTGRWRRFFVGHFKKRQLTPCIHHSEQEHLTHISVVFIPLLICATIIVA